MQKVLNSILDFFKNSQKNKRSLIVIGHIYFLLMLLLSIVLYQERMLSMDTANYAFKVLLNQDFYTGHDRTISYLPQILPLLALKAGCTLKTFLIVYSAAFILFYYLVYNIIVYVFRNPQAALFLALALGLSIRYKFYGPVGEVVLSIPLLALLAGWLSKPEEYFKNIKLWLDILIACIIATFLITGHPFITIGTIIFLGFHLLYHQKWTSVVFWVTSLYTGVVLYFKFIFVQRDAYETERLDRLAEAEKVLYNLDDYYISGVVTRFFATEYFLAFAAFIAVLIYLIVKRRWFVSLYMSISFLVVLAVVVVMHAYISSDIFIMLDGYMTHLGLIWAMPLAFVFGKENKSWIAPSFAILMAFSLFKIYDSHTFFHERIEYLKTAMAEHTDANHPKAIASRKNYNYDKLWIGWAMSMETLLISSIESPDNSRTIYLSHNEGKWDDRLEEPLLFLNVHFGPESVKQEWLPRQFFHLPEVPYIKIELEE